jgi:hypothetical protein
VDKWKKALFKTHFLHVPGIFMRRRFFDSRPLNPLSAKNWEADIKHVELEACDTDVDPLGYRAVFMLTPESASAENRKSFTIGASFLPKREHNLQKAGFSAPMTQKAIALIENRLGRMLETA